MFRNQFLRLLLLLVFGIALGAAACGDDGPTAPSDPDPDPTPEPATLTGSWSGQFTGALVAGDATVTLTQDGTAVTGDWSAPMPAALVAVGAPAGIDLAGPVTGTAADSTADLTFGFLDVFSPYFGTTECGLAVTVTSFDATSLEATWRTNDSCEPPTVDEGTLSLSR